MTVQHEVRLHRDFDRLAFAAAVEDIRTLFRHSEIAVAGPSGRPTSSPILEDDLIDFNGVQLQLHLRLRCSLPFPSRCLPQAVPRQPFLRAFHCGCER